MDIATRIRKVAKAYCGSDSKLAERLGLKQGTFSRRLNHGQRLLVSEDAPKILELFPDVNPDWLYFGRGHMNGPADSPEVAELKARIAELEKELQQERQLNRQLTTQMLVDGASDQDAATATGKASGGQG